MRSAGVVEPSIDRLAFTKSATVGMPRNIAMKMKYGNNGSAVGNERLLSEEATRARPFSVGPPVTSSLTLGVTK